jgi:predicted DNA-binding transcriptional regulator AlpA
MHTTRRPTADRDDTSHAAPQAGTVGRLTVAPDGAADVAQRDPVEALRDHPASGRPAPLVAAVEPLLVTREQLAELLTISLATLDRLRDTGKIPAPLALTRGCLRWSLVEIRCWIAAGAPAAREWAVTQSAQRNGRPR